MTIQPGPAMPKPACCWSIGYARCHRQKFHAAVFKTVFVRQTGDRNPAAALVADPEFDHLECAAEKVRRYDKIWLKDDPDGSPLRKYTRLQAEMLKGEYGAREDLMVDWQCVMASRSSPEPAGGVASGRGCNRFVIVPLYPQYAAPRPQRATVNDEVFKWALDLRWQPAIRTALPWHDHPLYIKALVKSLKAHFKGRKMPEHLMLSFGRIPQRYFVQGDLYHCHCMKQPAWSEKMGWAEDKFHVTFQSRSGSEPWLQPYT